MQWVQIGPSAIVLTFADKPGEAAFHTCRAIVTELEQHPPGFLREFTPAYTTMLLELDLRAGLSIPAAAAGLLAQLRKAARNKLPLGPVKKIPVLYNGPDLDRVATLKKLTRAQVISYHSKETYLVQFLGFAPGFPYLSGLNKKLVTPRLENPRPHVPVGSIAIGGEHTGIYTVETPGGWNIIGRTNLLLFNPKSLQPGHEQAAFFLKPGDRVRFMPVKELSSTNS